MNEYKRLCVERAHELARKPYKLTAAQIAERTGICEHYANKLIKEARREESR